jgi:hypothetical protein
MKALLFVISLLIAPVAAANPIYTIGPEGDGGGIVIAYFAKYWDLRDQRADVRVEGECDSACTMVLGIIPLAHICATPNAEFGFHSALREGKYAKAMTEVMWEMYPDRVIRLLTPLGLGRAKDHPDIIYIDAQKIVHPCSPRREEATAEPPKEPAP